MLILSFMVKLNFSLYMFAETNKTVYHKPSICFQKIQLGLKHCGVLKIVGAEVGCSRNICSAKKFFHWINFG